MFRTREINGKTITEKFQAGDVVQHFKRNLIKSDDPNSYLYRIICTAIHTETGESMVVYQTLYGEQQTYVRPEKMFLEKVDKDKYPNATQEYRFEKYTGPIYSVAQEIPSTDLRNTGLSLHALIALKKAGICDFSDLCRHTKEEIHAIPGIGPRSMLELDKGMKSRGISYKKNDK